MEKNLTYRLSPVLGMPENRAMSASAYYVIQIRVCDTVFTELTSGVELRVTPMLRSSNRPGASATLEEYGNEATGPTKATVRPGYARGKKTGRESVRSMRNAASRCATQYR